MIVLHAVFPIDPAERERALALFSEVVEASNREPGVIEYRAAADLEAPNTIRFFEVYEDEAASAAHRETAHFETLSDALPDLLAGEPEIHRFSAEPLDG